MVKNLISAAMHGTLVWDKSVTKTIRQAIKQIDERMSRQLAEVMHHEQFQKLEGSWRGLNHLVMNTETSKQLKLRMLNLSKRDLFKDLDKAVEFDQSQLFKKLYEDEFGMPGGEPFGALIGDYEITNHPEDIDLLEKISGVCAAAHCPFISAAHPELFGFETWTDLTKPRDIEKIFMGKKYTKWNSYRNSEDSRYVTLVLPRVLARLPMARQQNLLTHLATKNVYRTQPVKQKDGAQRVLLDECGVCDGYEYDSCIRRNQLVYGDSWNGKWWQS